MNLRHILTIFLLIAFVLTAELILLLYMFPTGVKHHSVEKAKTPPAKAQEIPPVAPDREALANAILNILGEDADRFSIYLLRPQTEQTPYLYQAGRQMRPASMIKVFILAKAMEDIRDGKHSLDETIVLRYSDMVAGAGVLDGQPEGTKLPLSKIMELMITESDNTATNILIDLIGMENINAYLKANGYTATTLQHKMMIPNGGRMNFSSAEDLGRLFTRIYRHECVSEYHDGLMIEYLLGQADKEGFPAALPRWRIAHKTGEIDQLYDDGGIFYGNAKDFILVIMNDEYSGRYETIERMKRIASVIANGFL